MFTCSNSKPCIRVYNSETKKLDEISPDFNDSDTKIWNFCRTMFKGEFGDGASQPIEKKSFGLDIEGKPWCFLIDSRGLLLISKKAADEITANRYIYSHYRVLKDIQMHCTQIFLLIQRRPY